MDNSAKYLIHAAIAADGVVERSDVVGAVYGQTEGLLGEELDIRRLQESSKLGRIDVEIETSGGQSVGEITIATSLDRVETATLAAALETIDRVGPCHATVEVTELEDVRAATRRRVVERAQELLLSEFEEATSDAIIESVRRRVATADVTTFEGLPAGPNVEGGDAVIVVEGRADVKTLLAAGVKNAIAVEGTDVPDAVAELTRDRRTTAFLDGDRGGELVLRELRQVGDVDAVAFAPANRSVEDLTRSEVLAALRSAVDVAAVEDAATARDLADAARVRTSGGTAVEVPETEAESGVTGEAEDGVAGEAGAEEAGEVGAGDAGDADPVDSAEPRADGVAPVVEGGAESVPPSTIDPEAPHGAADPDAELDPEADTGDSDGAEDGAASDASAAGGAAGGDAQDSLADSPEPSTVPGHVEAAVDTDEVRFLDADAELLETAPAEAAFDALEGAEEVPRAIVLDGRLEQRLLDLAAQLGVREVVAAELGEFTKRPTDVRVRTAEAVLAS